MQNSSCAWYLPWSLAAQQHKLVAMQTPFADKVPAVASPSSVYAAPPPQQHQQHQQQQLHQHSPNSAAAPPSNYQQPALHPSAGSHFPMAPAYNFSPSLLSVAQLQHTQQQQQQQLQQQQQQLQQQQQQQLQHHHQQQQQQLSYNSLQGQNHLLHSPMFSAMSLGAAYHQQALLAAAAAAAAAAGPSLQPQASPRTAAGSLVQPLSYAQELQPPPQLPPAMNLNLGVMALRNHGAPTAITSIKALPAVAALPNNRKLTSPGEAEKQKLKIPEKRKTEENEQIKDLKKAKLETKALKAKRPGFTDERYRETSYYIENGLRKVYPYYFTFTTFTKGRWVGEKILDIFAREFRAHPAEEYERCIQTGTLTVNFEKVPIDYRLKHNDLLANIVHRHEVPVTCQPITIVHMDEDIVVVNKPASIPVHPCGRYRHNTVVFILAKEFQLKNLRTIHRLDRLTSGLLLFGRSPKKARQMEQQIRNRQVEKEYICRVEGVFPDEVIECKEPIEVVSYKIGVCKVSPRGKDCTTIFQKLSQNGKTSVVLCKPLTGRMHQIRVHLQYLGYPILNDPLYNHEVFGPLKGRSGDIGGKSDDELIRDLITIHNAENWLGIDCDSDISLFKTTKDETDRESFSSDQTSGVHHSDDDVGLNSRETTPPCVESPQPVDGAKQPELPNWPQTAQCTSKAEAMRPTSPLLQTTISTQTGAEATSSTDLVFNGEKMTTDKHCYECKVHYRDPKSKDLVMYLHAWKYKGPGWDYETELPNWARAEWAECDST